MNHITEHILEETCLGLANLKLTTLAKITGDMKRIPVFDPPLTEQKAIAHIPGSLDDKIKRNRRMNETLAVMA